jgi:predicted metalloprotease
MRLDDQRESDNVEDQRGSRGGRGFGLRGGGGIGIGTIVLALVLWKGCGIDPSVVLGLSSQMSQSSPQSAAQSGQPVVETASSAEDRKLVGVVLAATEDTWQQIFAEQHANYIPPKLVLYSGSIRSGCGSAEAAMGPFYCPADQKVYLDMSFFKDMRTEMGVTADQQGNGTGSSDEAGDFARAYVIAHEIGHHVQNLLGLTDKIQSARQQSNEVASNQLSVRQELQADCFAGVWANRNQQRVNFLQAGDLEEAINAATQIGDDRLQQSARGYVVPDSFTHGTSAQRVRWFQTGFQKGQIEACDTFGHSV